WRTASTCSRRPSRAQRALRRNLRGAAPDPLPPDLHGRGSLEHDEEIARPIPGADDVAPEPHALLSRPARHELELRLVELTEKVDPVELITADLRPAEPCVTHAGVATGRGRVRTSGH